MALIVILAGCNTYNASQFTEELKPIITGENKELNNKIQNQVLEPTSNYVLTGEGDKPSIDEGNINDIATTINQYLAELDSLPIDRRLNDSKNNEQQFLEFVEGIQEILYTLEEDVNLIRSELEDGETKIDEDYYVQKQELLLTGITFINGFLYSSTPAVNEVD